MGDVKDSAREARLAEALRANLRRRKGQAAVPKPKESAPANQAKEPEAKDD